MPRDARGLVLAVSGGADSLALLCLAAEARARLALGPILVATVDHGLRPESADEARFVAELAARAGLAHRTLPWCRETQSGNLSAQARDARYRLLTAAALEAGAGCVVTAHHEDDQIETRALALARGEGVVRQAGMRSVRDLAPGLHLCRPFLDLPKARLVASLRARGLEWVEDPTNRDLRYARARIRAESASMRGRTAVIAAIRTAATFRSALDAEVTRCLPRVRVNEEAALGFEAAMLETAEESAEALLSRILRAAGGASRAARGAEIRALLTALRTSEDVSRTLGGCLVERRGADIRVGREYGRNGPADIELGSASGIPCFDERFDLDPPPGSVGRIVPLGRLGRGGAKHRTLPVLLDAAGRPIAAHPAVLSRLPEPVAALSVRERVTWRLYRDLAPLVQNAAKAPRPVGKDFAADYLSRKSKRVRADDSVEAAETQSQDG